MKVIWLFVDGLGLGKSGAQNPLYAPEINKLNELLLTAKPIDASLGVPGIPQSATGQTSIFCGVNAQKIIGTHLEGFPTKSLREIISRENVYIKVREMGLTSTFANGYWIDQNRELPHDRKSYASVSTVSAATGLGDVRRMDAILRGDAVYQDLTQESIVARGGDVEIITPVESAHRLLRIAEKYDLTVFEYFQTDRAGHSQDFDLAIKVLLNLQQFVVTLSENLPDNICIILMSDHGNIEDLSTPIHTLNKVPFLLIYKKSVSLKQNINDLTDILPATLEFLIT
ncbi:MAG: peptidase [Fibrobacteres bacterium]|nr:peptidase [Fibrobacterota bacterium]